MYIFCVICLGKLDAQMYSEGVISSVYGYHRFIYWTEWNRNFARIQRASMDGTIRTILHQQNIQRPYGLTIDYDNQVLYWSDLNLQRIECSSVNGSDRHMVINSGIQLPFDITILGSKLYISDWELGVIATDKSGGQRIEVIYNSFCDNTQALGIQSISEERQLLGELQSCIEIEYPSRMVLCL